MQKSSKTISATVLTVLLASILVLSLNVFAKEKKKKKGGMAPPAEKICLAPALQLKNCNLDLDNYSVRLWKQKLSVSNQVRRDLVDLPMKGEKVEWVAGALRRLGPEYYIEWVAWDEPAEKSGIQTKNWYVYRIKEEVPELILTKPIVKRIRVENEKPKSDQDVAFGLKYEKQVPTWYIGSDSGVLK